MLDPNYLAHVTLARLEPRWPNYEFQALGTALKLYRRARIQGWLARVRLALTGHPNRLLDLDSVAATVAVRSRHYAGMQSVPIRRICGSEGRCDDFDAAFQPLETHARSRWLGIATARRLAGSPPPVILIRVGDVFFVRDGHHRVSVARALGQEHIDAEVTVWRVDGRLPCKQPWPARERILAST